MPINADKPHLWKADIAQSVDFYNSWFMQFAPKAYRDTRLITAKSVEEALAWTDNLRNIASSILYEHPSVLPMLRMATAPPIARDRLIGLAGVSKSLVTSMEVDLRIPPRMSRTTVDIELEKVGRIIEHMADEDIFPWLESKKVPDSIEVQRAATVVADRLCGTVADPIIRNAQERRQLATLKSWLENRGYSYVGQGEKLKFNEMKPGTFAFRLNVPVKLEGGITQVNIPIDTVIMPATSHSGRLPLLIEAKSAGDFTNTNKRRKEEAIKITQLRRNYGNDIQFILFLCGYFDSGYLGYEAAERIDWVWEHRTEDLAQLGV